MNMFLNYNFLRLAGNRINFFYNMLTNLMSSKIWDKMIYEWNNDLHFKGAKIFFQKSLSSQELWILLT